MAVQRIQVDQRSFEDTTSFLEFSDECGRRQDSRPSAASELGIDAFKEATHKYLRTHSVDGDPGKMRPAMTISVTRREGFSPTAGVEGPDSWETIHIDAALEFFSRRRTA